MICDASDIFEVRDGESESPGSPAAGDRESYRQWDGDTADAPLPVSAGYKTDMEALALAVQAEWGLAAWKRILTRCMTSNRARPLLREIRHWLEAHHNGPPRDWTATPTSGHAPAQAPGTVENRRWTSERTNERTTGSRTTRPTNHRGTKGTTMTTMMTAPAGAEPDAVTLQIPAIPMTWEQASIMLDATFDAWRMLSGEIDAARGDDWQWIQEILALPAHTRYIKAAGDEAMVCSAAMRETWPGRWHDLLRARVQDVIHALVSHEREIRAMDPGMFARMPSPSLCDRVRKRHDPTRTTLGMTVQELAR